MLNDANAVCGCRLTGAFRRVTVCQDDLKRSAQVATSREEEQNSKPLGRKPGRLPAPDTGHR